MTIFRPVNIWTCIYFNINVVTKGKEDRVRYTFVEYNKYIYIYIYILDVKPRRRQKPKPSAIEGTYRYWFSSFAIQLFLYFFFLQFRCTFIFFAFTFQCHSVPYHPIEKFSTVDICLLPRAIAFLVDLLSHNYQSYVASTTSYLI